MTTEQSRNVALKISHDKIKYLGNLNNIFAVYNETLRRMWICETITDGQYEYLTDLEKQPGYSDSENQDETLYLKMITNYE